MTNQGPLHEFRDIKHVVDHYDAIFASIKSPHAVYSEGLADIHNRVTHMWVNIATAGAEEREKLQDSMLELGGQKKELEINYRANCQRLEADYEKRLQEAMVAFRAHLATVLGSVYGQSQPQATLDAGAAADDMMENGQPEHEQVEPEETVAEQTTTEQTTTEQTITEQITAEQIENAPAEDEPVAMDLAEDDFLDDGPIFGDSMDEPADDVSDDEQAAQANPTQEEATDSTPVERESAEGSRPQVPHKHRRQDSVFSSLSSIEVGTQTMIGMIPEESMPEEPMLEEPMLEEPTPKEPTQEEPTPKEPTPENTHTVVTRAKDTASIYGTHKRKTESPAPQNSKRRKGSRTPAISTPDPESASNIADIRRATRHSHSQSSAAGEFQGIVNAEAGNIYLTFWTKTKEWLAVLLLPMGDFNSVGIPGSITSCGLSESLPSCYRFNKKSKKYNWAKGFEDGKPLAKERLFPVMYFDGREFPHKSAIMWIEAKDLREFHPKFGNSLVPNMKIVRTYLGEHPSRAGSQIVDDEEEDVGVGRSEGLNPQLTETVEEENSNIPDPATAEPSNLASQAHLVNKRREQLEPAPLGGKPSLASL
ncbi:hypothetical protein ACHAPU_006944 [Fusarium lateritium]